MSKLIATLAATLFATAAFAQTNGVPPSQPPAGTAVTAKKDAALSDKDLTPKQETRLSKSKKRLAKREAKVGAKPIN